MPLARVPVLVVFHSSRAAENRVGSLMSPSRLAVPATLKMFGMRTWSERFFPTDGLSTIVLIFREVRSALSPIPES